MYNGLRATPMKSPNGYSKSKDAKMDPFISKIALKWGIHYTNSWFESPNLQPLERESKGIHILWEYPSH